MEQAKTDTEMGPATMNEDELVIEDGEASNDEALDVVGLNPDDTAVSNDDGEEGSDGTDQGHWNREQLEEAQSCLSRWARRWNVETDPYVAGISEAVSDGRNMTMWASLDPYQRLPTPELRQGQSISLVAQILGIIRNVLVFVPVAITWWAIGEATDRFGQHNSFKPIGDKTNFLDFWQDGYGMLDDIKLFGLVGVKIQEIALVDSLIIVAVVVLTLLSSALGQIAEGRGDKAESRALADREDVALVLTEALEGKRSASPESIAGSIADVLNDLVDASREVKSAANQLEQASMGVGSFSSQITELNTTLGELSQRVAIQVSGELVKAVDDLSASVARLNTAVVGDTTRLMGDVIAGLDGVTEQLERTGSSVEFGVKRLRDDLDAIHNRITGT